MAHLSIIDEIDYTEYGFNFCDGLYTPILNSDPIAPDAVIEMVSCKSCKLCSTARCPCWQSNQTCTDFCGCSEFCENTDNPMPQNVMSDESLDDLDNEMATEDVETGV